MSLMTDDYIPKTKKELGPWQETARQLDDVHRGSTIQDNLKNFCAMYPTEEASAAVQDKLDDETTCWICDETYKDPMILPCYHTFCLTCLQRIGSDRNRGDQMSCPLCRQEFTIPEDGFTALKKNSTMVKLIEITSSSQRVTRVSQCDKHEHENLCLYCCDCNEVICLVCLRETHQKHRLSDMSEAGDVLCSELQSKVSTVKQCMFDALKTLESLLKNKCNVLEKIQAFEADVYEVRHDMKALIDRHADLVLQRIDFLKKELIEEIENEEKEIGKHLNCLKSFDTSTAELASNNRRDGLFCKMARLLKEEFVELKLANKSIVERQLHSFDACLTKTVPSMLELYKTNNIIGIFEANIHYFGKPELVTTIETCCTAQNEGDELCGIAVCNNDVFIVYKKTPVVSIYDLRTHSCTSEISLKDHVRVMDAKQCVIVEGNIYIVNGITREILAVDRNRCYTKWSTKCDWGRLSVTAESTLVATCFEKPALKEYSLQGALLHEVKLCPSIVHPLHAIKLSNGHFIVSHGISKDATSRVCIVNDVGAITKSFGDRRGFVIQQLDFPCCLAVDEDENILVLDNNSRVLLLSPDLKFRRVLLTKANGLRRPVAMQLDKTARRLYIADCIKPKSGGNLSRKVFVFKSK